MTLILPIFGELKKGKLHILKKVGLNTFKEILKKYVYNSTVMFFNILLFCLKGYSETLNKAAGRKKKRLQHQCFPVNIGKFLRTPILKNIYVRLLLK